VIGVNDQQQVERRHRVGIDFVGLAGHREHHLQEVRTVGEVVLWIDERLADRLLVAVRGNRRQLGEQTVDRDFNLPRVAGVERVLIKGGKRADSGREDRHRMRVAREAAEELAHFFVQHRVAENCAAERVELFLRGQFAVDQEVGNFEEIAVSRQVLDVIAAITQDAAVAVEERHAAHGRAGVRVALVEGDAARHRQQLGDIDAAFLLAADEDW